MNTRIKKKDTWQVKEIFEEIESWAIDVQFQGGTFHKTIVESIDGERWQSLKSKFL